MDTEENTLTDRLRASFSSLITALAKFLTRCGLKPNTVTLLGLVGHFAGAALVATGHITAGGIVVLVMAPLDFLDGAMARLQGGPTKFGAFFDSVTDRYSELVIFGGLLVYYLQQADILASVLVYLAAAGSVLVSYTRARAQSVGYETKVGLLTRVERYLVLIPALIFNAPMVALWVIAALSNLTSIQRILHMRKLTLNTESTKAL